MYDYLLCVGRIAHDLSREGHLARFDGSELELLLAFLGHLNFETGVATASDQTLGTESGVSYPTANRGLNALVAKGYLERLPGGLTCGPVLRGMLARHEQRQGVKQPVVSSCDASNNNSSVELSEPQARASVRRSTTSSDIRQLVLRYGAEAVDRAIDAMEAQYPDDSRVLKSFGALVRRACEKNWQSSRQLKAEVAERIERQRVAEPEVAAPPVADAEPSPAAEMTREGALTVIRLGLRSKLPGMRQEALLLAAKWGIDLDTLTATG